MIHLRAASTAQEVEEIFNDPELFGRIAEDNPEQKPFEADIESDRYMMIIKDEQTIGAWCLYPSNRSTLNIHCNILVEYRHYGKEAGRLILKWFVEDCPEMYQKLNAEVPTTYPEVYHFTKRHGFTDEGINRLSTRKQGQLVDQWRLGITRDEAEAVTHE